MRQRLAQLFKLIETFLVKAPPLYVGLALIVAGVLGFEGMVTYNQSTMFCLKCHEPMGVYRSFEADSTAHVPYKQNDVRCLACHTDKDFYSFAGHLVKRAQEGFVAKTNAQVTELPKHDPGYTDADCLTCHNDVLKLEEADKLALSPKLAAIGLKFSHMRHFWVKDYPTDAQARLAELQAKTEWTEPEKTELDLLRKARLGRCSQCHDRQQPLADGETVVDRSINYFSINPMRCIGCHTDAVSGEHPGSVRLQLPREETCRRCHTGTFHGRFTIFRAECESADQSHCRRCHPDWQPEFIMPVADLAATDEE